MVRLDKNWTSPHPKPRNIREISGILHDDAILLPGGRWLLMVVKGSPVQLVACDLDALLMEKQFLTDIPDMSVDENEKITNMCAAVDVDSPMLAWNLLVPCGGELCAALSTYTPALV